METLRQDECKLVRVEGFTATALIDELTGIVLTTRQPRHENSAIGLNAWVHCTCIKEGTAPPDPFPELLVFDQTGEPTLKGEREIREYEWR